ncbi:MAG: hypothetical protein H6726_09930 [Sandaracinaceae bacterium]|nr:hypothetical protein [Myxococcales bacterium]MCB9657954.1 hypothetical protein [Sandaracinaceae bacterium]
MDDPHQKRVALQALRDVAEVADPGAVALAGFDAAVAGVARQDVEGVFDARGDDLVDVVVVPDRFVSRSSAPPPDEVAGLRHELSNAMTAIAALAARAEGQGTATAALQALARIRKLADSAGTAPSTVSGLRVGSREVSRDIGEMVDDLAPFAEQQRVAVESHIEPGLMSVVAVASLRLIVWNLLKNAIEASPKGALVTVSAQHRSGSLRLAVEDRGGGLPASLRERVFEAHFSTKDEGRGLGLSLVHAEVQRLGGQIELTTPRRGGTSFTVTLPGAQLSPSEAAEASGAISGVVRKQPLAGFRIALLCDVLFLERALAAVGATVSHTTASALQASEERYDVVVVDMTQVPSSDAVALRAAGRATRVIALVPDDHPCVVDGVDAALPRGFDLGELAATIERLLPVEGAANGT